jgi:hypothetical protein
MPSNFFSGVDTSTFGTDPGNAGALGVAVSQDYALVTAGAETRTIAVPTFANQQIRCYFLTDGGDCVVTVAAAVNAAGNNTITLADAGDSITLQAFRTAASTSVWRLAHNDGGALTTV